MSYGLDIYFPHENFPYEEWNSILSLFKVVEYSNAEQNEPQTSEYSKRIASWAIEVESRTKYEPDTEWGAKPERDPITWQTFWTLTYRIHIALYAIFPKSWRSCVPVGAHWSIYLDTGGQATSKAVWTQFAIPYYALSLIQGVTVHDCQWHREDDLYSFQDAETWAEFAARAVRHRTGGRDLVDNGLMTEDGKILF